MEARYDGRETGAKQECIAGTPVPRRALQERPDQEDGTHEAHDPESGSHGCRCRRRRANHAAPAASGADSGATPSAPNVANLPTPRPSDAATTAQRRIERDGYTNVQNLAKGDDGLWRG